MAWTIGTNFDQVASEARSYAFNKKYGTYSYLTDYRSVCENWNHIILDEIQKILGKDLNSKKVLALGANNGSERNINWMKTSMLANGCSEVSLVDAESEILLISKR